MKAEDTIVRCGEYDARRIDEDLPHQNQQAKQISVHPAFDARNLYYDYAIVHTKEHFEYDNHIRPICLPDQFESLPTFDDETCFAMGFGKDNFGKFISKMISSS